MRAVTAADFLPFIEHAERAVDDHPRLTRCTAGSPPQLAHQARVIAHRLGFTVEIKARTPNRRTMSEIHGEGTTVEAATADLIASLDRWAEAIR